MPKKKIVQKKLNGQRTPLQANHKWSMQLTFQLDME